MKIIIIIVFILLIIILYMSYRSFSREKYLTDLSEYSLSKLIPVGVLLYKVLSRKIHFKKYREVIHQRYGAYAFEERYELFVAERLTLSYVVFMSFTVLALIMSFQANDFSKILQKEAFGEGRKYVAYEYILEKEGEVIDGTLTVTVPEMSATEEEAKNHVNLVIEHVESNLSSNEFGHLMTYTHLNCPTSIAGVVINWNSGDRNILLDDGRIRYANLETETWVSLFAKYEFQNLSITKMYNVMLYPIPINANEISIESSLEAAIEEESKPSEVVLPTQLEGYNIIWETKPVLLSETNIMIIGIIVTIFFFFLKVKSLDEKLTKRKENIAIRLPNLINKIALLIQAGMTFHGAWMKITEDYIYLKKQSTIEYELYEEMIITLNDMAKGLSETRALEEFARRIGLKEVHRFVSIVTQNIKKGNRRLSEGLIELAYQGWEKREMIAKVKGEKASTKMVLPVIMMLIAIMMMIITPAVVSIRF